MGNYLKTKIMFELKTSDIVNYNILDYLKTHLNIAENLDLYNSSDNYKFMVYDYALEHNILHKYRQDLMPILCLMKWHIYSWINQIEYEDLSNSNKYILIQSEETSKQEWYWFILCEELINLFKINLHMNNLLIHAEDEDGTEYNTKLYFKNSLTDNYNIISNTIAKYTIEQNIDTKLFSIDNEVFNNDILYFAKVKPNAIIPTKKDEDAGYDIYPCFDEDYLLIMPHETKLIPTGIASAFNDDYYIQIQERGSTGSKGIKYGAGVIDSGYRGEWFISITNVNDVPLIITNFSDFDLIDKEIYIDIENENNGLYHFSGGDFSNEDTMYLDLINPYKNKLCCKAIKYPKSKAIAQAIIHRVPKMNVQEISIDELQNIKSDRGTKKLGSTYK